MIVAIIPARGGSRRIPRKNIRPFHGKPIIAYSIEAALQSGLFGVVAVSTEDEEIADAARQYGAGVIDRDPRLSLDEVGTQEVMRADLQIIARSGINPKFACCIYATAPMLTANDLRQGLRQGLAAMAAQGKYAYVHGWYYWGRADWFGDVPLNEGVELERPAGRWIDINTEEDFKRAEEMYAALHKEAA